MNVILDLDSTIISSVEPDKKQPRGLIGHPMESYWVVYERPHLQEFLSFLFGNFTVAVWTAASKDYALFIVEKIIIQNNPDRRLAFVMFDYHGELSYKESNCPKDLNLVWRTYPGFRKDNTIIIDDFEAVFGYQMKNAYPIPPFEALDPKATQDTELLKLEAKLRSRKSEGIADGKLLTKVTLAKAMQKIKKSDYLSKTAIKKAISEYE